MFNASIGIALKEISIKANNVFRLVNKFGVWLGLPCGRYINKYILCSLQAAYEL